ncbi:ribonuclease P protein subunit p30 [Aricia agestis]|uniref:ribonuclease P protein subunit p30 n=1 Tax=Aricia agestis TaxID=91739 RepID=UPI001C206447|nr:ribonuclease P protein subunit p30 [Aricia agestis]
MQALNNWGFCDLSINKNYDFKDFNQILKLGFHTIAINTHVEEVCENEPKKKKKKGDPKEKKDYIPSAPTLPDVGIKSQLNILSRVTIEFSDSSITHKLNQSENLKNYDIIAVLPKTLQAFQYACSTLDVDIVTFEPETRMPYRISRKLYRQAVERGIFFELMYSPAIKDSTCRRNIISNAHNYHAIGKSKNIIITSGSESSMYVRGVHDVVNLGFIFGLNSQESIEVLKNNSRKLILKAKGRKCGKHYMEIIPEDKNVDNKSYYGKNSPGIHSNN